MQYIEQSLKNKYIQKLLARMGCKVLQLSTKKAAVFGWWNLTTL
ncbi:hypothetical protein MIZ03_4180 [Rhodoferax lithotrophicus]|uniref:Uncharacterized protein n=1 Tax=Rhodoferax lithotrophicus TaxID=2798804 RepID=A0ABM7MSF8_9BURK|nr:hypothetical protein MIZ03_4180 [Rhodoferax sp. MIZ03]